MRGVLRSAFVAVVVVLVVGALSAPALAVNTQLRVGVVWSQIARGKQTDVRYYDSRVRAVEDTLRKAYPYVTEIGDTELSSTSRLAAYDVIVAPRTIALSSAERLAIRAFVAQGGGFVSMFGTGRWDYQSGRYLDHAAVWQFSSSWDLSRAWEWGELSELGGVKFDNDPLVNTTWSVASAQSGHQILRAVSLDTGNAPLVISTNADDYNEYVFRMPNNKFLVPLLYYRGTNTVRMASDPTPNKSGTLAGWATSYYRGRVVRYGFQLYDGVLPGNWPTTAMGKRFAASLIVNSVDWAGAAHSAVNPCKSVAISGNGWFSRGTLFVNETVYNRGSIQVRGPYKLEVYDPRNVRVWLGDRARPEQVPLPAGAGWKLASWSVPLGSAPRAGTWRVRIGYQYYEQLAGGWVMAYRDLIMKSTGSSMSQVGLNLQINPVLNWSHIPLN